MSGSRRETRRWTARRPAHPPAWRAEHARTHSAGCSHRCKPAAASRRATDLNHIDCACRGDFLPQRVCVHRACMHACVRVVGECWCFVCVRARVCARARCVWRPGLARAAHRPAWIEFETEAPRTTSFSTRWPSASAPTSLALKWIPPAKVDSQTTISLNDDLRCVQQRG